MAVEMLTEIRQLREEGMSDTDISMKLGLADDEDWQLSHPFGYAAPEHWLEIVRDAEREMHNDY